MGLSHNRSKNLGGLAFHLSICWAHGLEGVSVACDANSQLIQLGDGKKASEPHLGQNNGEQEPCG